jgi:hypothetical protein
MLPGLPPNHLRLLTNDIVAHVSEGFRVRANFDYRRNCRTVTVGYCDVKEFGIRREPKKFTETFW